MSAPIRLDGARILLSNDDGIEAEGLKLLERIARRWTDDVWTVAPLTEQSAVGHGFSIRRPLRAHPAGDRRFAVDGTPADAVMIALQALMRDARPTLMLSGVNRGGNLAQDAFYSGTCAAAREAALAGVPAIALSQVYRLGAPVDWSAAEAWVPRVVEALCGRGWPADVLVNVNAPPTPAEAVSGAVVTRKGRVPGIRQVEERIDPRGDRYFWILPQATDQGGRLGTDLAAIAAGMVAVTPLSLDLSHDAGEQALAGLFG